MKIKFVLTALSSTLVASIALAAASHAAAEGLSVTLNDKACGSYTSVAFDSRGHLQLKGDLTCLNTSGTVGPPIVVPPTEVPPTEVPDVPAGCGTVPTNMQVKHNHPWNVSIPSDIRASIALKPSEVYSFKINKPAGESGFGYLNTLPTANASATRTMVVSECPGSMKQVASLGDFDACKVVGLESKLTWSYDAAVPRGVGQCRLDPNKQYYINIKHEDNTGKNACSGSQCYFTYGYELYNTL